MSQRWNYPFISVKIPKVMNGSVYFCFFDETGLLNSPRDKFFGVGMIKIARPEQLYEQIKLLRNNLHFYDELKWTNIYNKNAPVIKQFIDLFFDMTKVSFSCYIFEKKDLDLQTHFKGNLYAAYESFASMQVCANLHQTDSAIIIMDDLSTPKDLHFERDIKRKINRNEKFEHNPALGVMRAYSKGVEIIQLTDLFLGAVCYEFKKNAGLITGPGVPKGDVLKHVIKKAGVKSLAADVKTGHISVWTFKPKAL